MPFDFGKADAVNPCQQADEVLMSILPLDRGYRLSRFGTYNPRELQIKFAGCEITNNLILKLKELELFFGVGNLQDKLCTRRVPQRKVLVAFAR